MYMLISGSENGSQFQICLRLAANFCIMAWEFPQPNTFVVIINTFFGWALVRIDQQVQKLCFSLAKISQFRRSVLPLIFGHSNCKLSGFRTWFHGAMLKWAQDLVEQSQLLCPKKPLKWLIRAKCYRLPRQYPPRVLPAIVRLCVCTWKPRWCLHMFLLLQLYRDSSFKTVASGWLLRLIRLTEE
jgi:hypothetical protein